MSWTAAKDALRSSFLHPRHLAQRELRRLVSAEAPRLRGSLLDVGCGQKPYIDAFSEAVPYIGMDVPSTMHGLSHVDVVGRAIALPFRDACFDSILCTEVLEHIPQPMTALLEMARVARPGAFLLLTVPLSEQLHEEPLDFYRFTKHGLLYILRNTPWRVVTLSDRGGTWLELGHRLSSFLYSSIGARRDSSGQLQPRLVFGPLVAVLCAAVQLAASVLDQVWHSPLSTLGYCLVAQKPKGGPE